MDREVDLSHLIESGDTKLVRDTVATIIMINQRQLMESAIVGRNLIPASKGAEYLVLAANYSISALACKNPLGKLWQHTFALAAAQKSGEQGTIDLAWEGLRGDFPELSTPVMNYLSEYLTVRSQVQS